MSIEINDQLPPFSVAATSNKTITNKDLENKYSVIYFYPKDSTPGCTTEGLDFTALHPEFSKLNTQIFGVSLDSMKRHDNFKAKQNFSFDLISDPDAELCNIFGVYQLKKNFGKEYMGIVRSTFLIDPSGRLVKEWRSVKVKEHAQLVLNTVKELQQA
ncbi:peroxiredoxin [Thiomicrorhabdus lithotrophica]|uniref:thioredoxin-dependent peroxiredoxin n=1 Tax=Thiomicrorhabdus lithotrophica TaxID=2949997 RepID=A0ABY8C718_9GAMM|nr:peroxiredoxin [Thiomicrorhabdus lithotrophica]WEJ61764.1 peroxiredoxin [Thiomicrorhabdus lithotrophica]